MSPRTGEINVLNTTHAVAIESGKGKLLTADEVLDKFGVSGATTAIEIVVPPGSKREVTIVLAHHNGQPLLNMGRAKLYLSKYYPSVGSVVQGAVSSYAAAKQRAVAYQEEFLVTCDQRKSCTQLRFCRRCLGRDGNWREAFLAKYPA
jgi:hypothetical protein